MIGDEVTFTVLGVQGSQVRVGINAPKSVAVHREEIYVRIKAEELKPNLEVTSGKERPLAAGATGAS